jgi:hypothetical protein
MPEKKAATNKAPELTPQTRPIIVEDQGERFAKLSHPAETLARVIFENCGAAKAEAVAKELKKLITAAGNHVPTSDSAEAMKQKHAALSQQLPADGSIPEFLRRQQ